MVRGFLSLTAVCLLVNGARAADEPVFSGPQVGEKITPFKVLGVLGPQAGKEFEVGRPGEAKVMLVMFWHEITRPGFAFVRPTNEIANRLAADGLVTHIVMLSADKSKAETFLQGAKQSLNLKCPASVSLDGLEGPGN